MTSEAGSLAPAFTAPSDLMPNSTSLMNLNVRIKQEPLDHHDYPSSCSSYVHCANTAGSSELAARQGASVEQSAVNGKAKSDKKAKPRRKKKPKDAESPVAEGAKSSCAISNGSDPSKAEDGEPPIKIKKEIKQEKITDNMKVRKKRDRFNGMTEEEVLKRTLPDHLSMGLDIVIVGINPGLTAAYVGHHYAGPGNHFWKCLYLSGLIPEPMNAYDDIKLSHYGIGFTNIVERTSRGSADLTRKEIKEGGEILQTKIAKFKPKIAAFNGKGIYEVFVGHKNFYIGKQPDPFPGSNDTIVYVMPSSSARCSQLPRAVDKVPFYTALKKIRDHICGMIPQPDDSEVCFPDLELKVEPKKDRELKQEGGVAENKKGKKKSTKQDMSCVPAANAYSCDMLRGVFSNVPMIKSESNGGSSCMGGMGALGANGMLPMPGSAPANPAPLLNMDSLFSSPPVLVKQEDTSELARYGLLPPSHSTLSMMPGIPSTGSMYTSYAHPLQTSSMMPSMGNTPHFPPPGAPTPNMCQMSSSTSPSQNYPNWPYSAPHNMPVSASYPPGHSPPHANNFHTMQVFPGQHRSAPMGNIHGQSHSQGYPFQGAPMGSYPGGIRVKQEPTSQNYNCLSGL